MRSSEVITHLDVQESSNNGVKEILFFLLLHKKRNIIHFLLAKHKTFRSITLQVSLPITKICKYQRELCKFLNGFLHYFRLNCFHLFFSVIVHVQMVVRTQLLQMVPVLVFAVVKVTRLLQLVRLDASVKKTGNKMGWSFI